MNIWMAKFLLNQNSNKLKFEFLKKLYIKLMYRIKYKYKYMDDLILSFENLFILLEYKNYKIELDDISIRMNIKLKNIIYIDTKDYSIRLDVDKISWNIHMRIKDFNDGNVYYTDSSLKDPINKNIPNYSNNKQKIYKLFDYIFTNIFDDFIKE